MQSVIASATSLGLDSRPYTPLLERADARLDYVKGVTAVQDEWLAPEGDLAVVELEAEDRGAWPERGVAITWATEDGGGIGLQLTATQLRRLVAAGAVMATDAPDRSSPSAGAGG